MISYQWGSQTLMRKLKQALTQSGLTVWMDIEQMGKYHQHEWVNYFHHHIFVSGNSTEIYMYTIMK